MALRLALLCALLGLGAALLAPGRPGLASRLAAKAGEGSEEGKKGFFGNFFQELDNFIDDATSRRLGNGASFYGKRKSSFYGENDVMRKRDSRKADAMEDYQGPVNSGYFVWRKSDDGRLEAQTRMKGTRMDRLYADRKAPGSDE